MKEIYIIDALRTPFGSFMGSLSGIEAPALAAAAISALLERSKCPVDAVGEVILGQVLAGGAGQAPARQAMRAAGIPDSAHALTINKVCGSGLKAVMLAADAIALGESEIAIAGGMECMSLAPYFLKKARSGYRMGDGSVIDLMVFDGLTDPYSGRHMGEIAEDCAAREGITRQEQDAFAIRSYERAQKAVGEGILDPELVPVKVRKGKADELFARDEEPFKVDFARVPSLRPAFREGGTITAANASTISDGAGALLLAGADAAIARGLRPRARIVAQATESRHPGQFPLAPIGAIEKACSKAGFKPSDIDLFEINEAFSSVVIHAIKGLGLDPEKVNVNGGACAMGHPIGASGARLAVTLVRELERRRLRRGLATLCIGGGEAVALIVERVGE